LQADLYRILQVASVTVFEKTPVLQAFQGLEPRYCQKLWTEDQAARS
jgi:hypothetical protein